MLAMSATDSLLPLKLELAERLVAQFSELFVMQGEPTPDCNFCVDLQAAKPPARMVARVTSAPSVRYFGPGNSEATIEKLIRSITDSGAIPSNINLGGNYEPSLVVEVLRHLARYWSASPPSRQQERRRTLARIHVVHAFDDVLSIISGESKDLDFQQNIETWTVENESGSGFGAIIQQSATDWLRVGTLLGIKREDGNAWGVAIVRRLTNDANQQRYVGIETLAKGGTRVKLYPMGAQRGHRRRKAMMPCCFRAAPADSSAKGELSLLMRMGTFSPRQSIQMRAYERDYLLMPKQLLEGGEDFDMAKFRVLQRAA